MSQSGTDCSTGPVVRCVLPGPHRVIERPDEDGTWGFWTAPGGAVTLQPRVRNSGPADVGEWQDWQADHGDPPPGRAGSGPDLELDEVAGSAAGVPQADTDKDDNGSYTTVTVAGGRRTDVVAIGATIPGTPGDHTISVGLVNRGPGTLRYPPFTNNLPAVRISLPVQAFVVAADDRCPAPSSSASDNPPESVTLRPGEQMTFTFTVRVAGAAHYDDGTVEADLLRSGQDVDRNPRNNEAKITVTAVSGEGVLPITGTAAATIASGAIFLVLAGVTVVAALRRRTPPITP